MRRYNGAIVLLRPGSGPGGMKRIPTGRVLALALIFRCGVALADPPPVNLGSTTNFAVLAGGGITVAGPSDSTVIIGDIGTYPTTTVTGSGNIILDGINHAGDGITQTAKNDLLNAYDAAAARSATLTYGPAVDLGGQTLGPGVYNDPTSFGITGTITLNAGGDPGAVWIFQAGSTLTLADGSQVLLTGGAQADNIFWQVGDSATLGLDSDFVGNLLVFNSVTVNTGAVVDGRILAMNAAVTMNNDFIDSVPEPGSLLPLGFGLVTLLAFRQRFSGTA